MGRELQRNCAPYDGGYRSRRAHQRAHARRYRPRRNSQFVSEEWARVEELLREEWSPEQVSGSLGRSGELAISHETIYRHVWRDLKAGGTLHAHLRCARKQCRKRYGRHDSRGRLAGKRMIGERPAVVERRSRTGDWEIDTVMGESLGERSGTTSTAAGSPQGSRGGANQSSDCILTLVGRKSGFVLIGKLKARTAAEANRALLELMDRHPERIKTITADNGTEPSGARSPAAGSPQGSAGWRWQFHWYAQVEAVSGVKFYFATPHHSWERGTNENTNGLIRQYLPKGKTMAKVTQSECDMIAEHLNNRPRKRHGYKTPNQCFLRH